MERLETLKDRIKILPNELKEEEEIIEAKINIYTIKLHFVL